MEIIFFNLAKLTEALLFVHTGIVNIITNNKNK